MIKLCCEYLPVGDILTSHTTECGFTLKRVRDMTKTYSQMHCTDKYS